MHLCMHLLISLKISNKILFFNYYKIYDKCNLMLIKMIERYFFRILDLSFNRIKELEGLDNLKNLKKLFLSSNKIQKIQNVNHLQNLNLLELGDNKIRVSNVF